MAQKKFCIIGLGYYGYNLALRLGASGAEVIAIDHHQDRIDEIADNVTYAACMDSKDEKALRTLNLQDMDAVIITIGKDFNNSILTTSLLQEMGVKKIIARVTTPVHEKLLKLMNIDEVLLPEADAAEHLAKRLMLPGVIESMMISKEYGIYEIKTPIEFIGKKLIDLDLRKKYHLNLVTIKQVHSTRESRIQGDLEKLNVIGVPTPEQLIGADDILVLFGLEKNIQKLLKLD